MVRALKTEGVEHKFSLYEESPAPEIAPYMTGHASWEQAYGKPDGEALWLWLMAHRRTTAEGDAPSESVLL
jgi:hypothetical protein